MFSYIITNMKALQYLVLARVCEVGVLTEHW